MSAPRVLLCAIGGGGPFVAARVVLRILCDLGGGPGAGMAADSRARTLGERAGLNDDGWPPLRFHDLRHTFASHLIVDLGLDPAQVRRMLGHARITITLDIYTHLFEDARHARDIRARIAASPFAGLLEPKAAVSAATVLKLR